MPYRGRVNEWRTNGGYPTRSLPPRYEQDPYYKRPEYDDYRPHPYAKADHPKDRYDRYGHDERRRRGSWARTTKTVVIPLLLFFLLVLILGAIAIGSTALYYTLNKETYNAGFQLSMNLPKQKYAAELSDVTSAAFLNTQSEICEGLTSTFENDVFGRVELLNCAIQSFTSDADGMLNVVVIVFLNGKDLEDAARKNALGVTSYAGASIVIQKKINFAGKVSESLHGAILSNEQIVQNTIEYSVTLTLVGTWTTSLNTRTVTYKQHETDICDAMKSVFGDLYIACIVNKFSNGSIIADGVVTMNMKTAIDTALTLRKRPTIDELHNYLSELLQRGKTTITYLKNSVNNITSQWLIPSATQTTTMTTATASG